MDGKEGSWKHLEVAGDLNVTDGSKGGKVAVGTEGGLRENGVLKVLVPQKHLRELPPDLLRHHLHPPLVSHAPDRPSSSSDRYRHGIGICPAVAGEEEMAMGGGGERGGQEEGRRWGRPREKHAVRPSGSDRGDMIGTEGKESRRFY